MDFLALPRRDLQALCKRNGVRANMTNAAMADALRALPKIDGIEEYVNQPVPVPEPEVEAVVEEENTGKQGSLLPRGRPAVAKAPETTETEEDLGEEKGNAKQALGVGRRGASRRARPVPVVPRPAAVAEEDSQREAKRDNAPAPVVGRRARPSPAVAAPAAESEDASAEEERREEKVEDPKLEATMDDVLALGVGRRGGSRRARPAPSVAVLEGKVGAEEQRPPIPRGRRVKVKGSSTQPIKLDDSNDDESEDAKPKEQQEDEQILGMGPRAQAEPAVAAPEAKAEEEQRPPVPRGRRVKANSIELTRLDESKEEKKEDTKPEEESGDAPTIGVGRRGASQRAPAPSEAPAKARSSAASKAEAGDVAVEDVPIRATRQRKPTMKAAAAAAAAEEKAPRRATRRAAMTSTLLQQEPQDTLCGQHLIRDEGSTEAVGAVDAVVEAVPIRATRHRKLTMKAAAAADEKAPPRATRRGTMTRTLLQQQVQEEPQGILSDVEAVGAPVTYQRCDALEELAAASDPPKEELNELDAPKQDEDQDVVIIEDEKLMGETPAEEPSVTDQECTDNSEMQEQQVGDEKCHAPLATQEVEDQDVVINENENLMEETPAEESSVTERECTDNSDMQEQQVDDEKCHAPLATQEDGDQDVVIIEDEKLMEDTAAEEPSVTNQEFTDNSGMPEKHVDDEKCYAPLTTHEESPILGLVSMVTKEASEDDEGGGSQDDGGSSSGLMDKGACEETYDAGEEIELVLGVQTLQAPLIGNESDAKHESEMEHFTEVPPVREETSEFDTKEVGNEKELTDIAELQASIVDEAAFLDCSSNISQLAEEEINEEFHTAGEETNEEVNAEDGLGCQEEGDVAVDNVLHDSVDNIISWVEMEKAGNITSEDDNIISWDEDDAKPIELIIDDMSQVTVADENVQEEKGVLITDEILQGTRGMHDDIEDDKFETVFVQADHVVAAENLPEQVIDCDFFVKTTSSLIVDDVTESLSKSIITMEPSVCKNSSEKNLAEPIPVLEEKGVKSEDLTKLSLGQLRAKLKEKLIANKIKEAKKRVALARVDENVCQKRVALARVDGNVCRSHAKGQQKNLNPQ